MKINNKDESLMIPYKEIYVGECFECGCNNYMKCTAPNGLVCDVNLETGRISESLSGDIKVKYLENGTFYKYGGSTNEN